MTNLIDIRGNCSTRCLVTGRLFCKLFSLLACFVFLAAMAGAQVLYGSLTGSITDTSGAVIPGATVKALNVATGVAQQVLTNNDGIYLINNLGAGNYSVTVTASSFGAIQRTGVVVSANQVVRVDAQLKAAQVTQNVTVSGTEAELQTDRADVIEDIGMKDLQNLPISATRDYESIFRVLPGITPPATQHVGGGNAQSSEAFTVNGGDQNGNAIYIDGASNSFPWLPTVSTYVPPADAIQTVNLVTNTFDSEQGMGSASQINVFLKSGTNQFHGAAWEYNTTSALQAKSYFFVGNSIPKYILNQFGADLGGPIKRDKLFFFGDWEHYTQRNLVFGYSTVPTAAMIGGNFAGTGTTIYNPTTGDSTGKGRTAFQNDQIPPGSISSAAQKLLALLPAPNVSGTVANDYFSSADYQSTRDNYDIKINYNPNSRLTAFGGYSISPDSLYDPQKLGTAGGGTFDGAQPGPGVGRVQRVVLGSTYTLRTNLLFDGNVGFTRLNTSAPGVETGTNYGSSVFNIPGTNSGAAPGSSFSGGIPYFELSGFTSLGNSNASNPFQFRSNVWVENGNMSWTKGKHSLRFGAEFFHYQMANFQANTVFGVRGGFDFTGGNSALNGGSSPNLYNSLADLLLGLPFEMGEDHQYFDPSILRENVYGFYGRDQWQVSTKLTLTYGLRYELWPYSYSDNGLKGISYNPATNKVNLGGIGGVPTNAGVTTGHGILGPRLGIAYRINDRTVIRAGAGLMANSEFFRNNVQIYPSVVSEQYTAVNSYSAAGNLTTGIPAFVGPNLGAGQLPLPTDVGTGTYAPNYRRGYVEQENLAIERDLGSGFSFQVGYVGNQTVRFTNQLNINAAAPGTGKAGQPLYAAFGNASTISELIPYGAANYYALQTQLTRHIGRGSFNANYTFSKALANNSNFFNYAPVVYRNYALSSTDIKHNFEFSGVYALPFGKGAPWLARGAPAAIAGGWQLSGVLSRYSGTPFHVTASGTSLNAPGNSQTANQLVAHPKILGGHDSTHPYFDPNAFAPVTTVAFGTAGIEPVRGPGVFDVDANLVRTFNLKERLNLQFRAEAFGLTNTPQFAAPSANVSNATFSNGQVTNLNGYDTITSSTGQRQLRFALTLTF